MNTKIVIMAGLIGLASAEANLVVNGDFELGNTGFASSYTYTPSGIVIFDPGGYNVGNNSKNWNGNFADPTYDHTSGSGLMLMANGVANLTAWSQDISVSTGVEYQFNGWMASLHDWSPTTLPRLEILVDNNSLGIFTGTYNTWTPLSGTWTAPVSGNVTLSIRDLNSASIGNDFALDDLSFEAIPEPASAVLLVISAAGGMWIRRVFVS